MRLKIIERLATGIRRIKEHYRDYFVNPDFEIRENSIVVILQKTNQPEASTYQPIELDAYELSEKERLIYKLLESVGFEYNSVQKTALTPVTQNLTINKSNLFKSSIVIVLFNLICWDTLRQSDNPTIQIL